MSVVILALAGALGLGAPGALGALGALGASGALGALGAPGALGASGALGATSGSATWRVDGGVMVLREAWDFNESVETLAGVVVGVDRRVWRGLAVRGELLGLRVWQDGDDAWLSGFSVGARTRWGSGRTRPVVDVGVGLSTASTPVPSRGTHFNYLAVIGGGVEHAAGPVVLAVTGRWFHASNNGREGRHLNPDIQALGLSLSIGWEH